MNVSVIVPLYNKARTIRRALDSIAAQTHVPLEVIVVDDGSTDGGGELAAAFHDGMLTVIRQNNAGPGRARNRGVEESRGELLAFLDADDEWLPEYLAHAVQTLTEQRDAAACVCGYVEYPAGVSREAMWRRRGVRPGLYRLTPQVDPLQAVYRLAYMSPWSTVIRRSVFAQWRGFYERQHCVYAEDSYLWLQVLLNEPVYFSFAPLVRFHTESSQLSSKGEGPRPVEPFLEEPREIFAAAPEELRPLAAAILGIRAAKTACMLGYWGSWRRAHALLRSHFSIDALRTPYTLPALVCSTPLGPVAGGALRACATVASRTVRAFGWASADAAGPRQKISSASADRWDIHEAKDERGGSTA